VVHDNDDKVEIQIVLCDHYFFINEKINYGLEPPVAVPNEEVDIDAQNRYVGSILGAAILRALDPLNVRNIWSTTMPASLRHNVSPPLRALLTYDASRPSLTCSLPLY